MSANDAKDGRSDGRSDATSELSYAAASRELDAILDAIEAGDTDIDALSEKVERASVLIKLCRQKLLGTEMRVKRVVDELAAALGDDGSSLMTDATER
jgi:exodeoxyribonuclease VII small subunit